jgi:hypothetical protein
MGLAPIPFFVQCVNGDYKSSLEGNQLCGKNLSN